LDHRPRISLPLGKHITPPIGFKKDRKLGMFSHHSLTRFSSELTSFFLRYAPTSLCAHYPRELSTYYDGGGGVVSCQGSGRYKGVGCGYPTSRPQRAVVTVICIPSQYDSAPAMCPSIQNGPNVYAPARRSPRFKITHKRRCSRKTIPPNMHRSSVGRSAHYSPFTSLAFLVLSGEYFQGFPSRHGAGADIGTSAGMVWLQRG